MKVVGLVGPKRSGKTTAAEALVRERGLVSIGFADALKDLALRVNPDIWLGFESGDTELAALVEEQGWEQAKEIPGVRRFLQGLGTGVRDINPNFWIYTWWDRASGHLYEGEPVVVPDVRFLNEAADLRHSGALLIRIARPDLDASDTHQSETELERIDCDITINNCHSIEWLQARTVETVDRWFERA